MWAAEVLDSPLVLLCLSIGVPLAVFAVLFVWEAFERFFRS